MNRGMRSALALTTLLGALGALALTGGCMKKTVADSGATATQQQILRNPTEPPKSDVDPQSVPPESTEELRPPAVSMAALHDEFMNQGPKLGYQFDASQDTLKGDLLPGGAQPIAELIRQYYQGAAKGGDVRETTYRKQSIANYLKSPVFPLKTMAEQMQETSAKALAESATNAPESQWQNALSVALQPAGDWRSVKEVRAFDKDYVVNHDDKYYKLLVITPLQNGLGKFTLQEHSGGKMTNRIEQPYRYDEAKGEIQLISDEGQPYMTFEVRQMSDESDIIYLKTTEDFVYTVFQRVGSAGTGYDASEAERQKREFEESGGTNARGGAGK